MPAVYSGNLDRTHRLAIIPPTNRGFGKLTAGCTNKAGFVDISVCAQSGSANSPQGERNDKHKGIEAKFRAGCCG
jgi:hypothetical protein